LVAADKKDPTPLEAQEEADTKDCAGAGAKDSTTAKLMRNVVVTPETLIVLAT
jgi:hypothetical protein